MKFLLIDQDVYAYTIRFLRDLGHDVLLAADLKLSRASDERLLAEAEKLGRILITRDRDYGNLVFVRRMKVGVIYLRILPSTREAVHANLEKILQQYAQQELAKAFVVVEPKKYRIRSVT